MVTMRILNITTLTISKRKGRNFKDLGPTVRLVLCAAFVAYCICEWQSEGCPGYTTSYLCRHLPRTAFIVSNESVNISSRQDWRKLIDLHNFTFLMNVSPCNKTDSLLLIIVHTSTVNFDKRATIRRTWGSLPDFRYRLLFLVGATNDEKIQRQLENETRLHGDIVQGNFLDTYRNLTYKHVMGLKWKEYFCPNVKYVLKTDDDVFVNLPTFLEYLSFHSKFPFTRFIRCVPEFNAMALRCSRSKWKVTWSEYAYRLYPAFCEGFVVLYSSDVVTELYKLAQRSRYFWIDDVFVTGILARVAGYIHYPFGRFMITRSNVSRIIKGNSLEENFLIGPPNLRTEEIEKLWKTVKMWKFPSESK